MKHSKKTPVFEILDQDYFNFKKDGFFVDFGAYDGIGLSNSLFFEKERNWKGICIEPLPEVFKELQKNRTCTCINACVAAQNGVAEFTEIIGYPAMLSGITSNYNKRHLERIERELHERGGNKKTIQVKCLTLMDIFNQYNIRKVDYMSVDTEGGEDKIIKSIDFSKITIDYMTIENNARNCSIQKFLFQKGYVLVRNDIDDLYIRAKLLNNIFYGYYLNCINYVKSVFKYKTF